MSSDLSSARSLAVRLFHIRGLLTVKLWSPKFVLVRWTVWNGMCESAAVTARAAKSRQTSLEVVRRAVRYAGGRRPMSTVARQHIGGGGGCDEDDELWDHRPSSSSSWTERGTLTPHVTTTSRLFTRVGWDMIDERCNNIRVMPCLCIAVWTKSNTNTLVSLLWNVYLRVQAIINCRLHFKQNYYVITIIICRYLLFPFHCGLTASRGFKLLKPILLFFSHVLICLFTAI